MIQWKKRLTFRGVIDILSNRLSANDFEVMANTISGEWREVVNAWAAMNATYVADFGDLPAWYVENSNTALLSAAAWKCGFPSLCEPSVDKLKLTGRPGRPKKYIGRLDMEVYLDGSWTWVEAKKRHFIFTHKADGRKVRGQRLVNLIDESRSSSRHSASAAKSYGWNVVAAGFFSASVSPDSVERGNNRVARDNLGKEAAIDRATRSESATMIERLERYRLEKDVKLEYAVFRNSNFRLQGWAHSDYPAAFGVILSRM